MALNITFDGFVYDGDGSITSSNVAYQAYFYKVGAGSSPSKWNNKRVVENTGYWNINLGDGDWLTQDGNAASGDEIIVVFWSPHTADRMDSCVQLDEWSCFRIILDGSSTYSTNVQIKPNICPDLQWSLPSSSLVGSTVYVVNSSDDEHSWNYFGKTMYHTNSWRTTLMTVNDINNSDYDWGDGSQQNDRPGTPDLGHTYSASGDYDVELVIEDECGCTVTGTDQIRIYNRAPVPNIIMTPGDPDPNEPVTFQYTGTDLDDTITNIAWTIGDSGTYGNTDTAAPTNSRDDVVSHANGTGTDWFNNPHIPGAFTNPGNHTVSIVISWWDGFTTQTMPYSEVFNQGKFSGPAVNFTQDPTEAEVEVPVVFTNTSTNTDRVGTGLPGGVEYSWRWTDGSTIESETDKPYSYEFEKTPTSAECKVRLCADWSDGWETHSTCVEKDVVFKTTVTVSEIDCYYNLNIIGTSDDGSVTGYKWTVYSGSGESGPWTETWSSPTNLEQNDKKICFSTLGFYKIEGEVYGTGSPTSDYEVLEVLEVCPEAPPADVVPICPPDVHGRQERERKKMRARELKPSMKGRMDIQPSPRIIHSSDVNTNRPFPGPKNI